MWYDNGGGGDFSAGGFEITTNAAEPIRLFPADLNSDGNIDILLASFTGDSIGWFQNDGGRFSEATNIATSRDGAR